MYSWIADFYNGTGRPKPEPSWMQYSDVAVGPVDIKDVITFDLGFMFVVSYQIHVSCINRHMFLTVYCYYHCSSFVICAFALKNRRPCTTSFETDKVKLGKLYK